MPATIFKKESTPLHPNPIHVHRCAARARCSSVIVAALFCFFIIPVYTALAVSSFSLRCKNSDLNNTTPVFNQLFHTTRPACIHHWRSRRHQPKKNCVPPPKKMASYLTWQESRHEMAAELHKLDGTQKK
jgi:hypothetical protein